MKTRTRGRACAGTPYPTCDAAWRVARKRGGSVLKCKHGGHWHIGHGRNR